jgi:tRNA-dihydrouridine synthase B
MVARAAISNPFIFREIKEYFATASYNTATLDERVELCLNHLRHSLELHSERFGIPAFRKYYLGYFKGIYGAARLRSELMTMDTYLQVEERLYQFAGSFEEAKQSLVS